MNVKNELKEMQESFNILKSLVVKNLISNYKKSILGFLWHFIIPIVMMIIYYVVFTQIRIHPIPNFWVYIACALFPFTFMTSNLTGGINCIVRNSSMIKKIYFPREIIVLSQVFSTFIIMAIGYSIVLVADMLLGPGISVSWIMIPVIMILSLIFVTGYVLLLSAIVVYVRDIQFLLSSMSMVYFFLTPMYFTPDSIDGLFSIMVSLNPFTYFIECYHQIVYYGTFPDAMNIMVSAILTLISIISGLFVFNKLKNGFVERL